MTDAIDTFITRWQAAGGSERANYPLFVSELARLLGQPEPHPAGAETKGFADALLPARAQAENYARALPEQVATVARVLAEAAVPLSDADLAARFAGKGPWKKRPPHWPDTRVAFVRAHVFDNRGLG